MRGKTNFVGVIGYLFGDLIHLRTQKDTAIDSDPNFNGAPPSIYMAFSVIHRLFLIPTLIKKPFDSMR
jgi:hypothetical protein